MLKARICQTLKWSGFPETNKEWEPVKSLKTHSLDTLLLFTGIEVRIKTNLGVEWSIIGKWSPENRYGVPGTTSANDAEVTVDAVAKIIKAL